MEEYYNRHYIRTRGDGCITGGWSDGPHRAREVTEEDLLLTDKGGWQFRLWPGGEENPALCTWDGIPLYRWDGEKVSARTAEEVEAERAALPGPGPSAEEDRDALLVDHELRITMLELGV